MGLQNQILAGSQLNFTLDVESKLNSNWQRMDEEIKQGICNEVLS
jgi:hypothetical protein